MLSRRACNRAAAGTFVRWSSTNPATPFHLIECPRDAMQGLKNFVPTADKIRFHNALLKVGFSTLDCGSFVSAPAVPQMRDTQEVLDGLDMSNTNTKLLVVIANVKGAQQAAAHPRVTYIGYPLSACETFQRKNTKRDIATALIDLVEMKRICDESKKELVVYISMAFGNPYGDPYSPDIVAGLVDKLAAMGVRIISLADTVGVADPEIITKNFTAVIPKYPDIEFGAHFHSGATSSDEKLRAAIEAGCKRIDGALGGMGGCPFAKSTLVGNVATETIVDTLTKMQIPHGLNLDALKEAAKIKDEVFGVGVKELLLATVLHDENAFLDMCLTHFRNADKHKRGYLDKEDFLASMKSAYAELGEIAPSDEVIIQKYAKLDISSDGAITFDEYMVGVRKGLRKRLEKKIATGL